MKRAIEKLKTIASNNECESVSILIVDPSARDGRYVRAVCSIDVVSMFTGRGEPVAALRSFFARVRPGDEIRIERSED